MTELTTTNDRVWDALTDDVLALRRQVGMVAHRPVELGSLAPECGEAGTFYPFRPVGGPDGVRSRVPALFSTEVE